MPRYSSSDKATQDFNNMGMLSRWPSSVDQFHTEAKRTKKKSNRAAPRLQTPVGPILTEVWSNLGFAAG